MTNSSTPLLVQQLDALLTDEHDVISSLANASALLKEAVPDLNWAGFYLYHQADHELCLGPFQGRVACVYINPDQGVCGAAFTTQTPQRIANVHEIANHIACDSASNAELVIPLTKDGVTFGVLDLDSPTINRFSAEDEATMVAFGDVLLRHLDMTA